jgi:hypothetical protein
LSAHKAAAELNRRKIPSATGGKWYAATVIKLRDRLKREDCPNMVSSALWADVAIPTTCSNPYDNAKAET